MAGGFATAANARFLLARWIAKEDEARVATLANEGTRAIDADGTAVRVRSGGQLAD